MTDIQEGGSRNIGRDKRSPEQYWKLFSENKTKLKYVLQNIYSENDSFNININFEKSSDELKSLTFEQAKQKFDMFLEEKKKSKTTPQKQEEIIKNYNAYDLINSDIQLPKDYISNIIMQGGLTLIGGQPASFKSFISYWIILCLASKKNFLEIPTQQVNCLIIDREMRYPTIKKRLSTLSKGLAVDSDSLKKIHIISSDEISLTKKDFNQTKPDTDSIEHIKRFIEKNNIKVVLFDSLVRFTAGSENDSEDMKIVFSVCSELIQEMGVSIIILHHLRKDTGRSSDMNSLRGSSDLSGAPDYILLTEKKSKYVSLKQVKNRHKESIPDIFFKLNTSDDESEQWISLVDDVKRDTPQTQKQESINLIMDYLTQHNEASWSDLNRYLKYKNISSRKSQDDALEELKENKIVIKDEGKFGKYRLVSNPENEDVFDETTKETTTNDHNKKMGVRLETTKRPNPICNIKGLVALSNGRNSDFVGRNKDVVFHKCSKCGSSENVSLLDNKPVCAKCNEEDV